MYNAGRLNQRIEIQRPVELGADAAGNRRVQWIPAHAVDAAARDVSGREYLAASAVQAEQVVTLIIRYLSDVHEGMRVLWLGVLWDVKQVNHHGYRGDWMSLKIKRVAHGGGTHHG